MATSPDVIDDRRRTPAVLALSLIAAGLYANTLSNGFVFDDAYQVVNNPWIRNFGHLREIFSTHVWAFSDRNSDYYRPLMHIIFSLLFVPFGPTPWVFHLANGLLHVFATVLVYFIALRVLPDHAPRMSRRLPSAALACGLIFAAHPVHTEAVAWISGLPDLACTVFYLLGILLFLKASDNVDRRIGLHGLGALCYLASALFKEPGATLPAVVVLLDTVVRPKGRNAGFWATRYGMLAIAGTAYITMRIFALGGFAPGGSGISDPLRIFTQIGTAAWRYIAMLVAPVRLNAYHTLETAIGLPPFATIVGLPLMVAFAVWRRSLEWTASAAVFLFPLLPALYAPAMLPGLDNPWAERYVYLPSAGFAIGLGALYDRFADFRPNSDRIATAILVAVSIAFSIATFQRNRVWKDDLSLWEDTVRKSPNSHAVHSYLGYALFQRGDIEGAIHHYRTSIGLRADFPDAHHNYGVALAVTGSHEAAVTEYYQAIRLRPQNALSRVNLSMSFAAMGHNDQALREADFAIELDPHLARAHSARGVALGNMGQIGEAVKSFQRAVELDPNNSINIANLEKARKLLSIR